MKIGITLVIANNMKIFVKFKKERSEIVLGYKSLWNLDLLHILCGVCTTVDLTHLVVPQWSYRAEQNKFIPHRPLIGHVINDTKQTQP